MEEEEEGGRGIGQRSNAKETRICKIYLRCKVLVQVIVIIVHLRT